MNSTISPYYLKVESELECMGRMGAPEMAVYDAP